jgi:hypothetical protein
MRSANWNCGWNLYAGHHPGIAGRDAHRSLRYVLAKRRFLLGASASPQTAQHPATIREKLACQRPEEIIHSVKQLKKRAM